MKTSPWGTIQHKTILAPGIIRVNTASHGGIYLSPERVQKLKQDFPEFRTWTGELEWLEEDCDATIAYVAFPDLPCDFDLAEAWNYFKEYQPLIFQAGKNMIENRTRGA